MRLLVNDEAEKVHFKQLDLVLRKPFGNLFFSRKDLKRIILAELLCDCYKAVAHRLSYCNRNKIIPVITIYN